MTSHDPRSQGASADPAAQAPPIVDAFTDVPGADGQLPAAGEVDADDMFAQGGE